MKSQLKDKLLRQLMLRASSQYNERRRHNNPSCNAIDLYTGWIFSLFLRSTSVMS